MSTPAPGLSVLAQDRRKTGAAAVASRAARDKWPRTADPSTMM
ncbi:hypothetical protein [Arthrobacter sp. MMS18-M83]|nr:hypothetical protein [Arthrobacter sp. MMS18-M83]WAH95274.1 hypothetical protein OW521_12465 [Arthrobacter sp. MMS18-M83]